MNKLRILSWTIIAGLLIVFILAMTDNSQEQSKAEPVKVKSSITEEKKVQKAVDDYLAEKLSRDATVTVYYGDEDVRCYRGTVTYFEGGEMNFFIHADSMTSQEDWW